MSFEWKRSQTSLIKAGNVPPKLSRRVNKYREVEGKYIPFSFSAAVLFCFRRLCSVSSLFTSASLSVVFPPRSPVLGSTTSPLGRGANRSCCFCTASLSSGEFKSSSGKQRDLGEGNCPFSSLLHLSRLQKTI